MFQFFDRVQKFPSVSEPYSKLEFFKFEKSKWLKVFQVWTVENPEHFDARVNGNYTIPSTVHHINNCF